MISAEDRAVPRAVLDLRQIAPHLSFAAPGARGHTRALQASFSRTLEVRRADYPARLARVDGLVLVDFIGLMPEVHGDPHPDVMATLDLAEQHDPLAMLIRIRNSRPPPQDTREELVNRITGLQDRMRCISIAVESSGFRGVAFRSFLAGARLVGAVDAPLEVAAKLAGAKQLLSGHVPEYGSFDALIDEFFDVPPPD